MFAQFTATNSRKAFFWCWAMLAILWVLASGWHAYNTTYLRLPFQPQGDCWGPLAKWPDGKPFEEWDRYGAVELDVPSNIEINKKNGEWAADAIAERNRWRETIWQKVKDCQAARPVAQRATLGVTENWSYLRSSLQLILLPPLVVLSACFMFGWIVRVWARHTIFGNDRSSSNLCTYRTSISLDQHDSSCSFNLAHGGSETAAIKSERLLKA